MASASVAATLDKVSGNVISNVTAGTVQGGGGLTTYFYGYGIECANATVTASANDISNITGGGNVGFGIYESTFAVG